MIDLASAIKLLLHAALLSCLFVPVGLAPGGSGIVAHLVGLAAFLVKIFAIGAILATFEISVAKMRVFRVPGFLGAALMLGFLGTILLFVSRSL